jgi:hypothetical protein
MLEDCPSWANSPKFDRFAKRSPSRLILPTFCPNRQNFHTHHRPRRCASFGFSPVFSHRFISSRRRQFQDHDINTPTNSSPSFAPFRVPSFYDGKMSLSADTPVEIVPTWSKK